MKTVETRQLFRKNSLGF